MDFLLKYPSIVIRFVILTGYIMKIIYGGIFLPFTYPLSYVEIFLKTFHIFSYYLVTRNFSCYLLGYLNMICENNMKTFHLPDNNSIKWQFFRKKINLPKWVSGWQKYATIFSPLFYLEILC